ncbi:hypothetical protein H0E87_029979 [Populus deltoides]|uniref:Uncharacterized protein n=1 Tax=Populus deltoides TaxID=3696 RepID=A0A8T2WQB3_POPDE|nr:hypothetical protein H0E87_029979 [Populus deltoides]
MGLQLVSTVGSLDEGIAGHGGCCSCFSMLGWPWWMLQLLQYAWVAMVAFRMRLLINVIGFPNSLGYNLVTGSWNSVEFRDSIQALQGSKDEFSAHEYSKEKNTAKKRSQSVTA